MKAGDAPAPSAPSGGVPGAPSGCPKTLEQGLPIDFVTIDVRAAGEAIGRITGENVAEDVIQQVFGRILCGQVGGG